MARNFEYASAQINLPHQLAQEISTWGQKHIPAEDLAPDLGREKEIHVTVLYGLHDQSPLPVRQSIENQPAFKITLGKINKFSENENFDVVKIEAFSEELIKLNKLLREKNKHTQMFKKYEPHVTIAYVKKEHIDKLTDCNHFVDKSFLAKILIFSSKKGFKTPIFLA